MKLLADTIRLAEPAQHFVIQFLGRMKAERMDVVARRDALDFRETGISQMPRQHNMTANSVSQQPHCCEAHSDLKRYACFLYYWNCAIVVLNAFDTASCNGSGRSSFDSTSIPIGLE